MIVEAILAFAALNDLGAQPPRSNSSPTIRSRAVSSRPTSATAPRSACVSPRCAPAAASSSA